MASYLEYEDAANQKGDAGHDNVIVLADPGLGLTNLP